MGEVEGRDEVGPPLGGELCGDSAPAKGIVNGPARFALCAQAGVHFLFLEHAGHDVFSPKGWKVRSRCLGGVSIWFAWLLTIEALISNPSVMNILHLI
jgi:hypothetical protein